VIAQACGICANREGNQLHTVKEMMFGFRDEFEYLECGDCGCLQISHVPEKLSKYYPPTYGAFNQPDAQLLREASSWIRFLRRQMTSYVLHRRNLIGRFGVILRPRISSEFSWLRRTGVILNSRILDVGCGSGSLVLRLHQLGFSNLIGVDPFIRNEVVYRDVRILKRELAEVEGGFDLVMLHHSLEHIPNHRAAFCQLLRILNPNGYVLIRTPVFGTAAWRHYGVNWVQLDAPRHLVLHSVKSMRVLAAKSGFEIVDVEFDSTGFQFVGSEQYLRNIPLTDERSHWAHPKDASVFSKGEIEGFENQARILNENADGDQAAFYLRRNR